MFQGSSNYQSLAVVAESKGLAKVFRWIVRVALKSKKLSKVMSGWFGGEYEVGSSPMDGGLWSPCLRFVLTCRSPG